MSTHEAIDHLREVAMLRNLPWRTRPRSEQTPDLEEVFFGDEARNRRKDCRVMGTLTQTEAREFGRTLRFIRDARRMTLRGVSEVTEISYQYLHNIEEGERGGFSDDLVDRLQRAYRLPEHALDDLLLRARIRSTLVRRGISDADADAAWRMLETRLGELGTPLHTDIAKLVAGIFVQPPEARTRRRGKVVEAG